jgi:hypothetical protein
MKPGSKTFRFSRLKCTKTHLRASSVQKNFFRLAGARHEGEGGRRGWRGGKGGEGSEGKGRKGGEGEGRGGKERGGKGRKGEGRGGNWVRSGSFSFTKSSLVHTQYQTWIGNFKLGHSNKM